MFYALGDDVVSITKEEISQTFLTAGYIKLCELENTAEYFGFSNKTVMQCREERYFHSSVDTYSEYYFASLELTSGYYNADSSVRIAMYVTKNLFLVVDISSSDSSVLDCFLKSIHHFSTSNIGVEKLVYAFLSALTEGDSRFLEDAELYINEMERSVLSSPPEEDFNSAILNVKQRLLLRRGCYGQMIDIVEVLEENENEIFDDSQLKYFRLFIDKADRLKDTVSLLRDSAVHLREAYESSLELQLNKTMKIFTVFTVIFSPLSFIAGWYGMNFTTMPELKWRGGYVFVIVLSLLTAAGVLLFFKKKRWI